MVLASVAIVDAICRGEQQLVAQLRCRYDGLAIQVRLLEDKLAVIDHRVAEVGRQINQAVGKGHVVDTLAHRHHNILDFGHVHDRSVRLDDVYVGIAIDHDQVILFAVVVNLLDDHVAQAVHEAQRFVFIGLLVQAEEVALNHVNRMRMSFVIIDDTRGAASQVIHPVLGLGHRKHLRADKRGVKAPITDSRLGRRGNGHQNKGQ